MKKLFSILACVFLFTACDKPADADARIAAAGDTVIIDFAGFDDKGVQFQGGTAEGFPLKLGSNQFVPGFEEQLVGAKIGESRDVKITFPTNYYPELAGKNVVFKVTVREIK